jgi:hypothetical protein
VKALSWINFALGLWLIVAAFTLPGKTQFGMAEGGVAGIIVVVLAYASAVGRPRPGISWSVAVAGLWILVISSGAVSSSTLNDMLVGGLILGVGAANAIYWHLPLHTGR